MVQSGGAVRLDSFSEARRIQVEKPSDLVVLPREVVNAVLAYLAERPWKEVHRLMGAVSNTAAELPQQGAAVVDAAKGE
jgi:hypothetical protein